MYCTVHCTVYSMVIAIYTKSCDCVPFHDEWTFLYLLCNLTFLQFLSVPRNLVVTTICHNNYSTMYCSWRKGYGFRISVKQTRISCDVRWCEVVCDSKERSGSDQICIGQDPDTTRYVSNQLRILADPGATRSVSA